jgi:uncharacterized lipoprotein NlpE involved in copper resistance
MVSTSTRSRRLAPGLAVAGLLLIPLAGCSSNDDASGSSVVSSAASAASSAGGAATSAAGSATSAAGSAAGSATSAAGSAGQSADNAVDCSGSTCSVTLNGSGSQVDVLGTTLSLGSVQDGEATLGVAGKDVTCRSGDDVSAGPLTLTCTTVTEDRVTLSASLG